MKNDKKQKKSFSNTTPTKIEKVIKKQRQKKKTLQKKIVKPVPDSNKKLHTRKHTSEPIVKKLTSNPILRPYTRNSWEAQATFNPAAVYVDGKVHLIYRAVGNDDVSVLGYASSHDGLHIHERLANPTYSVRKNSLTRRSGYRIAYSSGGGGDGGCEDPRLTVIDDVVYLLYTAFDGWGSIRIAMTRVSLDDFLSKRWNWEKPILISPPGVINKNWVIFPEKIKGKFAILHSITPKIDIDYYDTLDHFDGKETYIQSKFIKVPRQKSWDSWVRGAGPPPIKTDYGWLLLYHAMDHRDPDRYKLGAMLLDLRDPTKILYRSAGPILEPDECYENDGLKSGVVYSCGAVVIEDQLFIYYGGADTVTCVAVANLEHFLKQLMSPNIPKLKGISGSKLQTYAVNKKIAKKPNIVA